MRAPVIEAITGQPMPGEPSPISNSRRFATETALPSRRTSDTSFPLFSCAMPRRACTMGPCSVSDTNHSPLIVLFISIAPSGQTMAQTPHPSQEMGFTS